MHEFHVTWAIDVAADNAVEAAREAQRLMDDRTALWTFDVKQAGKYTETVRVNLELLAQEADA